MHQRATATPTPPGIPSSLAVAACAFALPVPDAQQLCEVQVTPAGEFRPSDGRELPVQHWRMTAQLAQRLIERHRQRTQPVVIDYEHQTVP